MQSNKKGRWANKQRPSLNDKMTITELVGELKYLQEEILSISSSSSFDMEQSIEQPRIIAEYSESIVERGSKTNKWTSTSKKKDSSYKSQSFRVKQNKKMDTEFKNRIFIELNNITSMASHRHNRSIPGSWRRPSNIEEIDDEEEHTGVATLSMDEEHNEQSNFHNKNSAYDQERKVETHTSKTEPSSFTKQLPVENTIHPYIQGSLDIDLQTIKAYRMSIQQMITMSKHISSRFLQSSSEDDETIDKISSINTSINEASRKISLVREEIRASIESRRSMLMGLHSLSHRYTTHYDIIDESRCIEVTGRTLSYNRTQYSYDRMCIDPYDIVHTYMYMMYDSIHSTIVCTGVDTYSLIHSIMLAYVGMIAHYSMYHTHVYIILSCVEIKEENNVEIAKDALSTDDGCYVDVQCANGKVITNGVQRVLIRSIEDFEFMMECFKRKYNRFEERASKIWVSRIALCRDHPKTGEQEEIGVCNLVDVSSGMSFNRDNLIHEDPSVIEIKEQHNSDNMVLINTEDNSKNRVVMSFNKNKDQYIYKSRAYKTLSRVLHILKTQRKAGNGLHDACFPYKDSILTRLIHESLDRDSKILSLARIDTDKMRPEEIKEVLSFGGITSSR